MSDTNLLVLAKEFAKLRKDVKGVLALPIGPQGEKGDAGEPGMPGTDGERGPKGERGIDGRNGLNGVSGVDGKSGRNGDDGKDGTDGVSVVDVEIDFDNHLRVTLSDGRVIDAGEVKTDGSGDKVFISTAPSTDGGGGGGGSTATPGSATIDFGAYPGSSEASIIVTGQAAITGTSRVNAWIAGDDTSGSHTASDHRYVSTIMGLTCGTPSAGTGFTIHARALDKLQGTWTVRWVWSD